MVELLKHDKMPLPKPLDGGMPPSQEPLPVPGKADDTTDDEG
jgi:hypothetical protein